MVEFEEDISAALAELQESTGMGMSDAVNYLLRQGLLASGEQSPFMQKTHALGLRVDVTCTAGAVESLEGPQAR